MKGGPVLCRAIIIITFSRAFICFIVSGKSSAQDNLFKLNESGVNRLELKHGVLVPR